MKRFQKLILAVAALTLVFLLWRIDPKAVWGHLAQVGWGMALILAQYRRLALRLRAPELQGVLVLGVAEAAYRR